MIPSLYLDFISVVASKIFVANKHLCIYGIQTTLLGAHYINLGWMQWLKLHKRDGTFPCDRLGGGTFFGLGLELGFLSEGLIFRLGSGVVDSALN